MATAVVATGYGGPEVLHLTEVEVGPPGPKEVVVDVRAAGVNPIDYKVYSGVMGSDPMKLPIRLGYEAAGVITAAGEGAEGPWAGCTLARKSSSTRCRALIAAK